MCGFRYLADEGVWRGGGAYSGGEYEVIVSGSECEPDVRLLGMADAICARMGHWYGFVSGYLLECAGAEGVDGWCLDGVRFETEGEFVMEFSCEGDVYGMWVVVLRTCGLDDGRMGYVVVECRREQV